MEPIVFNVDDSSEYIIILLLITLYSNVKEICLYQSVAKVITWAPTLADLALLHLCIDFVLFLLKTGKKPTDDRQQSVPFSVFLSNICYASESRFSICCVQGHRLPAKTTKPCASFNFFLSLRLTPATQTTYCIIAKK